MTAEQTERQKHHSCWSLRLGLEASVDLTCISSYRGRNSGVVWPRNPWVNWAASCHWVIYDKKKKLNYRRVNIIYFFNSLSSCIPTVFQHKVVLTECKYEPTQSDFIENICNSNCVWRHKYKQRFRTPTITVSWVYTHNHSNWNWRCARSPWHTTCKPLRHAKDAQMWLHLLNQERRPSLLQTLEISLSLSWSHLAASYMQPKFIQMKRLTQCSTQRWHTITLLVGKKKS